MQFCCTRKCLIFVFFILHSRQTERRLMTLHQQHGASPSHPFTMSCKHVKRHTSSRHIDLFSIFLYTHRKAEEEQREREGGGRGGLSSVMLTKAVCTSLCIVLAQTTADLSVSLSTHTHTHTVKKGKRNVGKKLPIIRWQHTRPHTHTHTLITHYNSSLFHNSAGG